MAPVPPTHVSLANAPPPTTTSTSLPSSSPRKSKPTKPKPKSQPHILHQSTFRRPSHVILHLTLLSPSNPSSQPLDPIHVSQLITSALTSYLGLTGAAILVDILKIEGRDVWVRVPEKDGRGVRAGLAGWIGSFGGGKVGWRVRGEEDGGDMFG
jgi:ribonuclease P/MRP protein subunit POP8